MSELSSELRKKLLRRKKKLKEGGNSAFIYVKANETLRFRALPVGEDQEFGMEVIQFYLGAEIKGVISPKSLGEPCALYDKYEELKKSKDEDDQALADKLKPKSKFVIPIIRKKDKMGQEIDVAAGKKLLMVGKKAYQQMIDLFLEPEQGNFTHPIEGYDLKLTRTGSGMTDTEYAVLPCKPSKLDKAFRERVDIEEMLRKAIPTEKETKAILSRFLGLDEDDDQSKKKKKKSSRSYGE